MSHSGYRCVGRWSQLRRYRPGGYLFIGARQPHFGGASSQTVIHLQGSGPFKIVMVGCPEVRSELAKLSAEPRR